MNIAVIRRFMRDRRVALSIYTVGSLLFALMYTSLYPSLKSQMQNYDDILKSFPKGFTDALGVEDISFSSFASYFSAEYLSLIWPLLAIILAISFAGKALAGAVETGTAGLELAQPVSRTEIYVSKYVGGVVLMTLFTVASILGVIPIAALFGAELQLTNWLKVCLQSWLFIVSIFSIAFAASAAFSERAKMYGMVAGVVLLMYVARVMSSLLDSVQWLKYTSFFHYYNGPAVLTKGNFTDWSWLVFVVTTVLMFLVGLAMWRRRDFAV